MNITEQYVQVAEALLHHSEKKWTDQADQILSIPASNYCDPDLFDREVNEVFRKLPLLLAASAELRGDNRFKAMQVLGQPILITRGTDGKARAFRNVCTHRGAQLAAEGYGACKRFSCPYHGWTFGNDGQLIGIADKARYGPIDRADLNLTELPCEEKAGLIFVILTPGLPIDIKAYLGEMLDDLALLDLENYHFLAAKEITGANWKVNMDGYLESYHFAAAHPESVHPMIESNMMKHDFFGPHIRMALPLREIGELRQLPRERWGEQENKGYVFIRHMFPNISLVRSDEVVQIAQVFPGPDVNGNVTKFIHLARDPSDDPAEIARLQEQGDFFANVTNNEDYAMGFKVHAGLRSGAIEYVRFGRNEVGNQHFHQCVEHYASGNPDRPLPVVRSSTESVR